MDRYKDTGVDEYTLAAYMAGTLPATERAAVTAYLAENAEARELLQLAHQSYQAGQIQEEVAPVAPVRTARPALRRVERPARPAVRRLGSVMQYAAAAAVLAGIGFGLRLAFVPPTDTLRSDSSDEVIDVAIRGTLPEVRLSWEAVEDAREYRVVVWDLGQVEMVAEYEVDQPRLRAGGTEVKDLNRRLTAGRAYAIRVDAVDTGNRVIQSSESVEFTPGR